MIRDILTCVAALLIAGQAFAAPSRTIDFDSAETTVSNLAQGGTVAVRNLTKIEAIGNDEVLSESTFFYPAPADKITKALSTPEGLCHVSAFCKDMQNVGPTADGKGWKGEITVDLTKLKTPASRDVWSPEFVDKVQTAPEKEYKAQFEVRTDTTGAQNVIHFTLLNGRIFKKLDVEAEVFSGGAAATLVVLRSHTVTTLSPDIGVRVDIAKRVMRTSPKILASALESSK